MILICRLLLCEYYFVSLLPMKNQATIDYVRENREGDVRQLALKGCRNSDVDMPWALDQIRGWQMARNKLPQWAAMDGLFYPPHLSMEQCSSELTAKYKRDLLSTDSLLSTYRGKSRSTESYRLSPKGESEGAYTLIDLTGGFGVDFSYMAQGFQKAVYVERNPELCEIARHNFQLLGLNHAKVICSNAEDYLKTITPPPSPPEGEGHLSASDSLPSGRFGGGLLIYLDPARRDIHGRKTYAISDCTPDVVALKDKLLSRADYVMVKLSPMLDLRMTAPLLSPNREKTITPGMKSEIHIVSVGNECKELVVVMKREQADEGTKERDFHTKVVCVNILSHGVTERFEFDYPSSETYHSSPIGEVRKGLFLYEPNASIMKAGCFAEVAAHFNVSPIGPNSHLFVSEELVENFPGRRFLISAVSSMNKKELKDHLKGIGKANLTIRNFPLSVAELRKRLKLADGGDLYLFATTQGEKEHILLFTKKN